MCKDSDGHRIGGPNGNQCGIGNDCYSSPNSGNSCFFACC